MAQISDIERLIWELTSEVERLRAELESRDEADFYTYRYKAAIANENLMFRVRDELAKKIEAMRPVVDAARVHHAAWAEFRATGQGYLNLEKAGADLWDAVRALDEG